MVVQREDCPGRKGSGAVWQNETVILQERPDGIRIIRVKQPEDALAYRATFAGAYQDIFSEPPYNERFYPSEAQSVLAQHLSVSGNITLLAVKGRARVVGFGIAIPVAKKLDIVRELRGLLPVKHTFYLSELGVLSSYRRRGLGSPHPRETCSFLLG